MTVVTDMVTTHAFWFDRRADLVVVPTDEAREVAIEYGIPAGNVRVVGLPTAERFRVPPADPMAFRDAEGWRRDLPVILVVGGGDGTADDGDGGEEGQCGGGGADPGGDGRGQAGLGATQGMRSGL